MDGLAAMRVFVRVVEAGGLSAAGRALGLAPSSVSRRITELEQDVKHHQSTVFDVEEGAVEKNQRIAELEAELHFRKES